MKEKLKAKFDKAKAVAGQLFGKLKGRSRRSQLIYTGLAVTAFGVMLIWLPLGVITAGVSLLVLGYYWEDDD